MDDRDRFDTEVLAQMLEAMEAGHDPLGVLEGIMALGYSSLDAARIALKFECLLGHFSRAQEDLTEDEIQAGATALVAGVESYLMNSGR